MFRKVVILYMKEIMYSTTLFSDLKIFKCNYLKKKLNNLAFLKFGNLKEYNSLIDLQLIAAKA